MKLKSAPSTRRRWKKNLRCNNCATMKSFSQHVDFLTRLMEKLDWFYESFSIIFMNSGELNMKFAEMFLISIFPFSSTFFHFRLKPPNCAVYRLKTMDNFVSIVLSVCMLRKIADRGWVHNFWSSSEFPNIFYYQMWIIFFMFMLEMKCLKHRNLSLDPEAVFTCTIYEVDTMMNRKKSKSAW